jgi:hypothetical protein
MPTPRHAPHPSPPSTLRCHAMRMRELCNDIRYPCAHRPALPCQAPSARRGEAASSRPHLSQPPAPASSPLMPLPAQAQPEPSPDLPTEMLPADRAGCVRITFYMAHAASCPPHGMGAAPGHPRRCRTGGPRCGLLTAPAAGAPHCACQTTPLGVLSPASFALPSRQRAARPACAPGNTRPGCGSMQAAQNQIPGRRQQSPHD